MSNFIQHNGQFYPLAGNKITIDGKLYDIKDTDKIVMNGKPYYMGDIQGFVFPEIYDGNFYVIGNYVYDWSGKNRYKNENYTEVKDANEYRAGLSEDGRVYSIAGINYNAVPLSPEGTVYKSISGYPLVYTDDGGIDCIDGTGDIYPLYSGIRGGVNKKIKTLTNYGYFLTEDGGIYLQEYKIQKPNPAAAEEIIFYTPVKIAEKCSFISGYMWDESYNALDGEKAFFLYISKGNLYKYHSYYKQSILYDNAGNWNYATSITYHYTNFHRSFYGYGIRDGMLMQLDPEYPKILDSRTGWTKVSNEINYYSYLENQDNKPYSYPIYGICEGNLYKIDGNTVTPVSESGDFVDVWGSYKGDYRYSSGAKYAFAGRSNGHLYRIEDTKLTDLGSVN